MRFYWLIIAFIGSSVPALANNMSCIFESKICPAGNHVFRTEPDCSFAPCPGEDMSPVPWTAPSMTPANIGLLRYIDAPLQNPPSGAQTVRHILEHRSAYNGKQATVHGFVVITDPNEQVCPITNALPPMGIACQLAHITIADTDNENRDRNVDAVVILPAGDETSYRVGQTVEMPVIVSGNKFAVILSKK